ncbi:hypothetical protein NC651_036143 [Populus alba x Populus x berolinensis]|nr:hypothetical protein NC651_036143 [Populus alba x Populus x berolinensis]
MKQQVCVCYIKSLFLVLQVKQYGYGLIAKALFGSVIGRHFSKFVIFFNKKF